MMTGNLAVAVAIAVATNSDTAYVTKQRQEWVIVWRQYCLMQISIHFSYYIQGTTLWYLDDTGPYFIIKLYKSLQNCLTQKNLAEMGYQPKYFMMYIVCDWFCKIKFPSIIFCLIAFCNWDLTCTNIKHE